MFLLPFVAESTIVVADEEIMRSAPHYYCSDGKGRDKNLNVQGIWRKVSEKSAVKERKGMKRKKSRNDQGIRSPEAEAPGQIFEKYTNI